MSLDLLPRPSDEAAGSHHTGFYLHIAGARL